MRQCLICKKRCIEHYGICSDCEKMNAEHRGMSADLTGYNAVVTGGRINIGYAVCLRLLRNGAKVIAVTRFPYDALKRYSEEKDFEAFRDRLFICGFDLKRADRFSELIGFVKETFPEGLDILVNNAAQTIRKAPSYYNALTANEDRLRIEFNRDLPANLTAIAQSGGFGLIPAENNAAVLYETPDHNSWVSKSDEISAAELLEVQLINVTAPFILTAQLKSHMAKSIHKNRFVINVSSVEGRFNRKMKLARHVHTNMAKASLNMMTHSLAAEYASERIFMYSVDPGWVSNQFPENYEVSKNFKPYLTFDDGAARICYPVYIHLNDESKPKDAGCLYKDYSVMEY
ncbi:MAG: SDR family oxidoreductase [Oscillospiraceae bacterium]|nr:SDR family oxidoreductase [Oscillospiraceae bacterium]